MRCKMYWILNFITFFIFDTAYCSNDDRYEAAVSISNIVAYQFMSMLKTCIETPMPNQNFLTENIKNFINNPSKTTVGFAPKFTSNRKYFANLLSTAEFKDMLASDEEQLRREMLKKIKYCDETIMDPSLLKEFYDRETDQSKF